MMRSIEGYENILNCLVTGNNLTLNSIAEKNIQHSRIVQTAVGDSFRLSSLIIVIFSLGSLGKIFVEYSINKEVK